MESNPAVFTKNNDEGKNRVLREKRYAFFMESSTIEYMVERNCELTQVGGLLDNKGYGIAMPLSEIYHYFYELIYSIFILSSSSSSYKYVNHSQLEVPTCYLNSMLCICVHVLCHTYYILNTAYLHLYIICMNSRTHHNFQTEPVLPTVGWGPW